MKRIASVWTIPSIAVLLTFTLGGCQQAETDSSEALSPEATNALLNQLPPIATPDTAEAQTPSDTAPPPSPEQSAKPAFPEKKAPVADTSQPPTIERFTPEGEVDRAAMISITFSQPMVAVGSHEESGKKPLPISIKPQVEGQWRWLDTKSLVFEPDAEALPMATEYTVSVAQDITSVNGDKLSDPVQWQFATAPLQVTGFYPESDAPTSNKPVLVLVFNQAINPNAVLDQLVLTGDGQRYALNQADEATLTENHKDAKRFTDSLEEEHWLAVTPSEPLPWNQSFSLELKAGVPAKTGHRLSADAQRHRFKTAGPLQFDNVSCGHNGSCNPESGISVSLSHGLADDWDSSLFTVSPEVEDLNVNHHGNHFYLNGSFKPETEYTLRLKAGTKDRFGRVLENDLTTNVQVGDYPPGFTLPGHEFITVPSGSASLPVMSRNIQTLNVELRRVTPEDWQAFQDYREQYRRSNDREALPKPGDLIEERTVTVEPSETTYTRTDLSLKKGLNDADFGHVLVFVNSPEAEASPAQFPRYNPAAMGTWVQVTNLSISSYTEPHRFTAWVTDLLDGHPINGAEVSLQAQSGQTDEHGLVELSLGDSENTETLKVIKDADQALFPQAGYRRYSMRENNYYRYPTFVFTDRHLYQPGETAHFKALLRERTSGTDGDIRHPTDVTHIEWTAYDGQMNELESDRTPISPEGSVDITLPIPTNADSGMGELEFTLLSGDETIEGYEWYHPFMIEEFRRPEYQVSLDFSTDQYVTDEPLRATASASYYSGGPLPNAPVEWQLSLEASHYAPPGWEAYRFGRSQPIWARSFWPTPAETVWEQSISGQTNAAGEHTLTLAPNTNVNLSELFYAHSLSATANVTDVNRQQWSASAETLIHPSKLYVGLRTPSLFAKVDEAVTVEWVTVNIKGKPVKKRNPAVSVERLEWKDGDWVAVDTAACKPNAERSGCEFVPEESGQYRVTAKVRDSEDRESRTQMTLWVAGDARDGFPTPEEGPAIKLIPDQEEYSPGETARIQVQTPFAPTEVLLTVQRQGLVDLQYHRLDDGLYTFEVPIKETSIPSLTITAEAIGGTPDNGELPQSAFKELSLPISTESRKLTVRVQPENASLKPGETATVDITVTDGKHSPASGAELTFYAVDQSVLDLAGYELPLPLEAFYSNIEDGVSEYRSRSDALALPPNPSPELAEEVMVSGARASTDMRYEAAVPKAQAKSTAAVRSNFSPLATFESTIKLDQQGKATVSFELPDNLTRYRLIGVAHTEQQFGTGEATLEVGLPLMVRPSLPRFLNLGDKAELPVVVQNTTDRPMTVELAARASNLTLTGAQGRRLTIPANDRKEVRFTAQPLQVGDANVQVIVQSGQHQDAAEITLPVQRPATSEAFAQYGSLTGGNEFLQVAVPDNVYPDFGGLKLTTSSTQFQSLSDAFLYLLEYPYGCSEQIASRLMAIASLEDLLQAFNADGLPDQEAINQSVGDILARLEELQNQDGGWGFWTRNGDSQAYLSVHVTHALLRAREAGYDVTEPLLTQALRYTRTAGDNLPKTMEAQPATSIKAYSLYVQSLAGEPTGKAAVALFEGTEEESLSIEAMGWLLSAAVDHSPAQPMRTEILRRLNNQLRETAATASFVEDYNTGGHWVLHGSRRTDAVVLDALLSTQPQSDLIEKLSRGLLNDRRNGHWGNTQENVFALLALKQYFLARENVVPDFTARAWLGDQFLGEQHYRGRDTQTHSQQVPMKELKSGTTSPTLALQHEGQGRLYYRVGMEYAPEDLQLEAARHGFQVERHYEAINEPSDVTQTKDGTWEIKAGAAVRVTVTMTVPARRHHVALTDRLPAGFEALNPALETTAEMPDRTRFMAQTRTRYWQPHWYQHQQLRDDRAEAFSTEVEAGVYEYEYTALATTPGEFVVPPAKAEEMYRPETFGRSATGKVRVLEAP
ncbi:Ig-like domain-containing alpha-2-macroglobulin family protein [Marinimicrobium agarilyticum]|uniref:Ig-like domain-containing alpha-2-macroglobulin family protein n=1 Tax=Marinimicrobium agarilyticum TaxID=306546 RepID=UPI00041182F8|nr:Ig-like domain-containing alpha-2-macroglobulin family protein [Marinimicrobium agarilyticum]